VGLIELLAGFRADRKIRRLLRDAPARSLTDLAYYSG
jgi:hypothetical protein